MVANTALSWVDCVITNTSVVVTGSSVASTVGSIGSTNFAFVLALSGGGVTSGGNITEISNRVGLRAKSGCKDTRSVVASGDVTLVSSLWALLDVGTASSSSGSRDVNDLARISGRRTVGNGKVGVSRDVAESGCGVASCYLTRLEGGLYRSA